MPLCIPVLLSPVRGDLGLTLVLELLGCFILGRTTYFLLFCVCFVGLVAPGTSHLLGPSAGSWLSLLGSFLLVASGEGAAVAQQVLQS